MWLRGGHCTSAAASIYPTVVTPTYLRNPPLPPTTLPPHVAHLPVSHHHVRPQSDCKVVGTPMASESTAASPSQASYFSSMLRHSPKARSNGPRELSPAALLRNANLSSPSSVNHHVRHLTMAGAASRTPSPMSSINSQVERRTDLASFAAATRYQPKPIRLGETSLTGELAVVRSPREVARGRALTKLALKDSSYRRSSRSRRPVSEQPTLRPHFSLSSDTTGPATLRQPQRLSRGSDGFGRFTFNASSLSAPSRGRGVRSMQNPQAVSHLQGEQSFSSLSQSSSIGGANAHPLLRGQTDDLRRWDQIPSYDKDRIYSAEVRSNDSDATRSRKRGPVVPPLALTKVVSQQQQQAKLQQQGVASSTDVEAALGAPRSQGESHRSNDGAGSLDPMCQYGSRLDVNPWARAIVIRDIDTLKSLPTFSDAIRPCQQAIHPNIRVSSSVLPAYQAWVPVALKYGWIEECDARDTPHIFLKPKIRKAADGHWKIQHDCSIVNAMATAVPSSSCQWSSSDVHKWALEQQFLGRLTLLAPSYSIQLDNSQKPYYGFRLDSKIYRYCRMPAGCAGASRHLQRSIKWALEDLPPELAHLVRFRGDEIFCGGSTADQRDRVICDTVKALGTYGFRISKPYVGSTTGTTPSHGSPSSRNARILCAGLIHDRGQQSLVLPPSKIQLFERLVAELHTPRWVPAAEELLKTLHQVAILMPMTWKRESNALRRILQSDSAASLLDASVYLVWDELPRRAAGWHTPFPRNKT